ncbi:MAG: restriction endonuclease subunit S [Oscillospiraceae bacterium]|nr:restriction endonuclease subunit S [Oscillospiraceae bacterium]
MNEQIKKRIEQILRGEVPEGYKHEKVGIIPQEWKVTSVGKCVREYKMLSNDVQNTPVYSSSRKGLVPQSEYYDLKEAVETNLGYKIVPQGYVTYRHMSDDDIFHFNINNTGTDILVSSEYPVFTASQRANVGFLIPILNETARFRYFCRTQKLGGTRTRLYFKNLEEYHMGIPPLPEQDRIAAILTTQDKVIELKEKLLAEKQRQKKYLCQQLLTGKKRLPGFNAKWQFEHLGKLFAERVETKREDLPLLAITGAQGIIPRSELDLKDNSSEDKSKYLRICVGDIGYNTMRMWQGVSAYSNHEGIVSPAYTILKPVDSINAKYFAYLFKMPEVVFLFYRFSQGLVDDTRNLKYDNFRRINVNYPMDKREQDAIVEHLSIADQEISLLKKSIDAEKQKKKALMQLLLSGIVRVKV